MTLRTVALTLTLLLALGTGGITAQDKVGTVHFATSCSATVQQDFERAVAMLHSFWFSASTGAFTEARGGGVILPPPPNGDGAPDRKDGRGRGKGRGAPGDVLRRRPTAPGRRALPDPQLRLSADRREGFERRPALRLDRARRASRTAYAVPHLHPAGLLAGVDRGQPGPRQLGGESLRPAPRARLPDVRVPPDGAGRGGPGRRRPHERDPQRRPRAPRDGRLARRDFGAPRARA